MDKNQIQPFEKAALYEIFASFYLQVPTVDTAKGLLSMLKEAKEILPSIDFEPLIKESQNRLKLIEDDKIKELEQEYYDHFYIPSTKNYIPPYESSVIDTTIKQGKNGLKRQYGSLWSESTYHVSLCYESVGFNPWDLNIEKGLKQSKIPDHIGFELGFMAYLCHQESVCMEAVYDDQFDEDKQKQNAKKWNKLQHQFLNEHVEKFVSAYFEIAKEKFNPFYLQLMRTINEFIKYDLVSRVI